MNGTENTETPQERAQRLAAAWRRRFPGGFDGTQPLPEQRQTVYQTPELVEAEQYLQRVGPTSSVMTEPANVRRFDLPDVPQGAKDSAKSIGDAWTEIIDGWARTIRLGPGEVAKQMRKVAAFVLPWLKVLRRLFLTGVVLGLGLLAAIYLPGLKLRAIGVSAGIVGALGVWWFTKSSASRPVT